MHRQAADEIERQAGTGHDRYVLELAHHFVEAAADGDAGRGIDYAVSAARRFSEQLAFPDARRWYRTALRLLEAGDARDDARRLDLLVALGHTEALSGRPVGPADAHPGRHARPAAGRRGRAPAGGHGLPGRADVRAAAGRRGVGRRSCATRSTAVAAGDDATAAPAFRPRSRFELSFASAAPTASRAPTRSSDQALEVARQSPDRRRRARRHPAAHPHASTRPPRWPSGDALSEELFDLGLQLDEPLVQFRAVHFLVQCAFEDGDLVEVDRWIQLGRGLLRRLRLPVPSYVLAEDDALRALLVGDLDDAERTAERLAADGRRSSGRTDRPEQLAYAFSLRHQQGRAGELSDLADQLVAYGESWMGFTPLVALYDAGRPEDARELLPDGGHARRHRLPARAPSRRGGDQPRVPRRRCSGIGRLRPAGTRSSSRSPSSSTRGATIRHCGAHHLGMLAAVAGDREAAERWFETAVRVHEAASAALLAAETRLEWARYRASSRRLAAGPRELADEAREIAIRRRSSGIDGQARALLSAIDRARAAAPRSSTAPPSGTPIPPRST